MCNYSVPKVQTYLQQQCAEGTNLSITTVCRGHKLIYNNGVPQAKSYMQQQCTCSKGESYMQCDHATGVRVVYIITKLSPLDTRTINPIK
jgi:hypothetical protein